MKKIVKLSCLTLILSFLGGCYDYQEINDIAIITSIFISKDMAYNQYAVSFEIAIPSNSINENQEKTTVYSGKGSTISQIIKNASSVVGKELYFGHTQLLVIDEELSKQGVKPILDYFVRNHNMRLSMNVVISNKALENDFFQKYSKQEILGISIPKMLSANQVACITPNVELYKFIDNLFEIGTQAYLPFMEIDVDNNYKIEKTSIFKDNSLVSTLSPFSSRYFMFLKNIGTKGGLIIENYKDSQNHLSFEIRQREASINPYVIGNQLYIDVGFEGEYSLIEVISTDVILEHWQVSEIENELSSLIKDNIINVLKEFQYIDQDALSINKLFLCKNPDTSRYTDSDFEKLYQNAIFNVSVKSEIIDSGRTMKELQKLGERYE